MDEMVIRCIGRALSLTTGGHVEFAGQCGRVFRRSSSRAPLWVAERDECGSVVALRWNGPGAIDREPEPTYRNRARAAGWAIGPDGDAMCPRCRRPAPDLVKTCRELARSTERTEISWAISTALGTFPPSPAGEVAAAFNAANPIGTVVDYWRGERSGEPSGRGRTTHPAAVLSGHTPVVWIEGCSGCIALTHVQVVAAAETTP